VSGPARESGLVNARLGLLAVLTCVTLVLTALRPGLAVPLVIFSWPALCGAYRLAASAALALRGAWANGGSRPSASPASVFAGQEAVVLAAGAAAEVVPPAAGVAVGGGQCRCAGLHSGGGTRSAPGVSHREYLLPGQTGAIRGTQDQLTRMNLPLPPAVVGGRRAITGHSTPGNHGSSITI
jgi:hypothetical protein